VLCCYTRSEEVKQHSVKTSGTYIISYEQYVAECSEHAVHDLSSGPSVGYGIAV
jgi:hypothetical protein